MLFLPASWAVPIPQPAWRSKGSTTFTNLVYGEILLFGCCINIIFCINKVIFQILWTILCIFIISSQPAVWCLKISQLHENWWGTPFFEEELVGCSSNFDFNRHFWVKFVCMTAQKNLYVVISCHKSWMVHSIPKIQYLLGSIMR